MIHRPKSRTRFSIPLLVLAAAAVLALTQPAGSQFGKCLAAEGDNSAEDKGPPIRIKAGSEEKLTDSAGNVWQADQGFEGGETISRPSDMEIENTDDPEIYRSERYSMDSFSHELPNGKYPVRLHFAETFEEITGPGQRVFSFDVEGKEFKDFDVAKVAKGVQRAYIEEVDVDIDDGKLEIKFTPDVQNPMINGIEILPAKEAEKSE
jgi:hypothetical protein